MTESAGRRPLGGRGVYMRAATSLALFAAGCAGPPEPTMSAPQPILEARQDAGAQDATPVARERGATHCSPDVTNDLGAAMALGFSLVVIEPVEASQPTRWTIPSGDGEAVGTRFSARVVRSLTRNGARLPETIEVHQWDAVVYADGRTRMESTDDSPGHATPRQSRRMLALVSPDAMGATLGWRLVRSWHLRNDDSVEGSALGQRVDAPSAAVFDAYAANAAQMRAAITNGGIGGAR